jgi:adenosylcobyric acid synthase
MIPITSQSLKMMAKTLMIQGASSSVGKSLLVAALCRCFARRGVRVAPFKAQNMSNNAAVCLDGAEIGRSQAVQAAAAGIEPVADLNPVLLKPEADARSQVIVMGRPWRTLVAGAYYQQRAALWSVITAAFDRLRDAYDLVLIEGAGSPAELNLRAGDMVNMAVARYAQAPVLLVGDIDRGGVFAQLLGTLWLLEPAERALVRGLVVNKFRGDFSLFADGVRILESRSALPVLGVLPFMHDLHIPEEDAAPLDTSDEVMCRQAPMVDIAVIQLPRIANFNDFSPLAAEPGVRLRYVSSCATLGRPDAVVLPGSKSTIADLIWLRERGLARAIVQLAASGAAVVGICGGYQMLGHRIHDPQGVESARPEVTALSLLPVETTFEPSKATHQIEARIDNAPGWLASLAGQTIQGYEIHMGRSVAQQPWLTLTRRSQQPVAVCDGAVDVTGRIWGCYLHGLFTNPVLRRSWLSSLGWKQTERHTIDGVDDLQSALDALASQVETRIDMRRLEAIIWGD